MISNQARSEDRLWLKICANSFSINSDIFLCLLYISPKRSTHLSARDNIWNLLEEEIARYSQEGHLILAGDFNARIGTRQDFILHDSTYCTHLPPNYISDYPLTRISEDNTVNEYGRELLQLCKGSQLRIVNGRVGNDKGKGKYMCFTRHGNSVVDYVITSPDFVDSFHQFEVGTLSEISDHCPLLFEVWVESYTKPMSQRNSQSGCNEAMSSESLPIQPLKIQPGNRQSVLKCFKSIAFRIKLDHLMEKIYELPLNLCVEEFSNLLRNALQQFVVPRTKHRGEIKIDFLQILGLTMSARFLREKFH